MTKRAFICSYCGVVERGEPQYCIHQDGFDEGPQRPLCAACGENEGLSCDTIWRHFEAQRNAPQPNRALN